MKRALLVQYASSDEDDIPERPITKKRKLPTLSSNFQGEVRVDNPALHQGRIRTTPHVEGQFVAHVYIPLTVDHDSRFNRIISDAIDYAKDRVPILHTFWEDTESPGQKKRRELHLSLSRPIYLRAHQRDSLKTAIRAMAKEHKQFQVSFADFAELTNDESTRVFLAVEVGAGHMQLQSLVDTLRPTLQTIRQKHYYDNPRFHASFSWALLERPAGVGVPAKSSNSSEKDTKLDSSDPATPSAFPTIPHLPRDLVEDLQQRCRMSLTASGAAVFNVETVRVRIGKDVFNWTLQS